MITRTRIVGVVLMIAAAGAAYWMLTDDTFSPLAPEISGDLKYTSRDTLLADALMAPYGASNIFWLRTRDMEHELLAVPAISGASVDVALPNHLAITVTERLPAFALRHAGLTYLVDETGLVLARTDNLPAEFSGPVVQDLRSTPPTQIAVGSTLDAIDLDAILEIGALTPALIDSQASSLSVSVTDDKGFVISAQPSGWEAIFGLYTPNLRPTDIIPRQVQCLRSLLGAAEPEVRTVYLAPLDDRCGTYLPAASARATPTPTPAR